jgi:hypothetical protein
VDKQLFPSSRDTNATRPPRSINFRHSQSGFVDSSSRDLLQKIERLAATLILTPFATAACARLRVEVVKCVGEDNVIDPF